MATFIFKKRDQSDLIMPDLEYRVQRYSKDAFGGPRFAWIEARGSRTAIFELIEHLRAPVEIYDENHEAVWWGYIHDVRILSGGLDYGVSLSTMANSVAAAYTENHFRATTAYSTNSISTGEYGTKQKLLSRSDITEADALQMRDTHLEAHKYPVPYIRISTRQQSERVLIVCRGWLSTLEWRYYSNDAGLEKYEKLGTNEGREIGEDARPIFAQAFQLSSAAGWTASSIWIRLYKRGSPVDNFQLGLYSDSGGDPNAALATATLAGASVATRATWTEFTLSSAVALATGTTYWIHNSRSGAIDRDNFYIIGNNPENGYLNGDPKYYNTDQSAWVDASHKGDQNFRVMGDTTTTAQIQALITDSGEFFTGSEVVDASGVSTNAYRDGDQTALYELRNLLATGSTNDRRMLVEVTRGRVLRIYEEPAKPTVSTSAYSLKADGTLYTQYGREARPSACTVAVWCNLGDVVPATVDLSRISDPSVFFIEEAEYNAVTGNYSILRARNQTDVFDIGGVR